MLQICSQKHLMLADFNIWLQVYECLTSEVLIEGRTLDNEDGKVKIVTEASVRRRLQLANSDGISSLPTTEIFEQLSLMG
ncbi:hypothetical protein Tco_1528423, partial [Tanacetum coccineum]